MHYDCVTALLSTFFYWKGVVGPISDFLADTVGIGPIVILPVLGPVFFTVFLIRLFLKKISLFSLLFIPAGFVLAWVLSWACFLIIPYQNENYGLVDLVKAGYPVLWGTLFYMVSICIGKFIIERKKIDNPEL